MSEILPNGNSAYLEVLRNQLYPHLPEELRGRLPSDEDWRRLLESARAGEKDGEKI